MFFQQYSGLEIIGLMFQSSKTKNAVCMERHSGHCQPGLWNVFYMPWCDDDITYDAVIDDFGNLVRIN